MPLSLFVPRWRPRPVTAVAMILFIAITATPITASAATPITMFITSSAATPAATPITASPSVSSQPQALAAGRSARHPLQHPQPPCPGSPSVPRA